MIKKYFERRKAFREAESLSNKFRNSKNVEEIFDTAEEMKKHFEHCWAKKPADLIGAALLDIMRPKKQSNFKNVVDLTGGRPDTAEWIAFLLIVDRSNSYYYEYFEWLNSAHDHGQNVSWIIPILQKILPDLKDYNYQMCQKTINSIW